MALAAGTALTSDGVVFPSAPSWDKLIGDYVKSFRITRGRQSEFSQVQAGEAEIVLDNSRGYFDASNPSSPFAGSLLTLNPFRINVTHPIDGSTHDVFTGYIENWDYLRQGPRAAQTTARAVDLQALLARADVNISARGAPYGAFYAALPVDDRIKAALTDAGVPSGSTYRFIASGNVNLQGHTYDGTILEVIEDAAEAEFPTQSMFFIDKSGRAMFVGRHIRGVDNTSDPVDAYPTIVKRWHCADAEGLFWAHQTSDANTWLPIVDMQWSNGKESLYNSVLITPEGVNDTTSAGMYRFSQESINKFGRNAYASQGLMILDSLHGTSAVEECESFSNWLIGNYYYPHDRISSITFHGQMDDGSWTGTADGDPFTLPTKFPPGSLWDFILNVDLNHRIVVLTYNPPVTLEFPAGSEIDPYVSSQSAGGGSVSTVEYASLDTHQGGFAADEFIVEGISHDVSRLNDDVPNWTMTLDLSRATTYPWSASDTGAWVDP